MSWIKPSMLNGYLSNILYRVNYIPQGGNVSDDLFIRHSSSGSPQNFTLVDLLPDTVYNIMVFAGRKRNDGVERWSGHVSEAVKTWQIGEWNVERGTVELFIQVFLHSVGRVAHRFFRSFGWETSNYWFMVRYHRSRKTYFCPRICSQKPLRLTVVLILLLCVEHPMEPLRVASRPPSWSLKPVLWELNSFLM